MRDDDLLVLVCRAGLEAVRRMAPAEVKPSLAPVGEALSKAGRLADAVALLAKAPLWAAYVCVGCDDRRPGLPNVIGGFCRECGPRAGVQISVSLWGTFAQAASDCAKSTRPGGVSRSGAVAGFFFPVWAKARTPAAKRVNLLRQLEAMLWAHAE